MIKEKGKQQKTLSHLLRGRVVSAKLPQTVTVLVERTKVHPIYGKSYRRSKKYLAHTTLSLTEGDLVEMIKCKPISKNKHFLVLKMVGKDIEAVVTEQLKEEAAKEIAEAMPVEKTEETSVISNQTEEKVVKDQEKRKPKQRKEKSKS